MSYVVDCSITLPWFLEDERTKFTDQILNAIHEAEYWVPSIWRLEMVNGLLMAERRKRIDKAWRIESVDQAARLNVRVDPTQPSMTAVANLADRHGLTAYDAAYLELAMRQKFGLITQDQDLARAADAEGLPLQSPGRSGVAQKRRRYNV
jgi:predicted nucleic acid-binding protein